MLSRVKLHALAALTGSVLVWTGMWSLLDDYGPIPSGSFIRDTIYFVVGMSLTLMVTRTYFLNAGIDIFDDLSPDPCACCLSTSLSSTGGGSGSASTGLSGLCTTHAVRAMISLPVTIMMWVGLYNLVDAHLSTPFPRLLKEVIVLGVGFVLMMVNLLLAGEHDQMRFQAHRRDQARAAADDDEDDEADERAGLISGRGQRQDSGDGHSYSYSAEAPRGAAGSFYLSEATSDEILNVYARGLLAVVGPVFAWVGLRNLLEEHVGSKHVLREVLYIACGLFALLTTRTLVSQSAIQVSEEEAAEEEREAAEQKKGFTFTIENPHLRRVVAFFAYITFWTGLEALLEDGYVFPSSIWREILLTVGGVCLLIWTDTFATNAGVLNPMSALSNLETYSFRLQVMAKSIVGDHTRAHDDDNDDGQGDQV